MNADLRGALRHPGTLIATFFGAGYCPSMPGAAASGLAFLLYALHPIPWWGLLFCATLGVWGVNAHVARTGRADAGEIVVDQAVGTWVALYAFEPSVALGALFLFRVLIVIKPFPIYLAERLPGGVGIMADDILTGLVTNLILRLLLWAFVDGGIAALYAP